MPLERRGDEVDHERGAQSGKKEPAIPLRTRPPDGSSRIADEDRNKPEHGQEGEQAGLGALLEIHVVDLFDALEPGSVLQPRVLESPSPRAREGALLPRRPGDPPVVSPGAYIQRGESLAGVSRLVRAAEERRVGLSWTAVPLDDHESAQGHRKHSSGHDEDPESPPENR